MKNYVNNFITDGAELITKWKNCSKEIFIISFIEFALEMAMEIEIMMLRQQGNYPQRNGYVKRTWKTLIGEITINVPKLRKGDYEPFFQGALDYLEKKYKQAHALLYVAGITTCYVGKFMKLPGLKNVDKMFVSRESRKYLDGLCEKFNSAPPAGKQFIILSLDALYETIRIGCKYVKQTVIVVCGFDELGRKRYS